MEHRQEMNTYNQEIYFVQRTDNQNLTKRCKANVKMKLPKK